MPLLPRGGRPDGHDRSLPAVAHLLVDGDRIVGGIARRADDYALVLSGRVVAATDSAGMAIAMLRHARVALSNAHTTLVIRVAPALETPATQEAEAAGLSLDAYLALLEAERAERAAERKSPPRLQ